LGGSFAKDVGRTSESDLFVVVLYLRCTECGRRWDEPAERWRVYFSDDDQPEPASYCPDCAKREFSD
jgi:hypothetical protein